MKKFICFLFVYCLLITSVFAKDMRFIQVTDVNYKPDNESLSKIIEAVNNQKNIDFVVFTGDSIIKPDKELLKAFLKDVRKIKRPCYFVIGDRDVNKKKDLSKVEYLKFVKKNYRGFNKKDPCYTFEKHGVVFVVVDGAKEVIPSRFGYYKPDVIDWVDANLSLNADKNVIILQHFPLIPPSNRESYYTFKPADYLKVLENHKNVKAVISGHFGVNKEQDVNGIMHISTAPAPEYRIIDILNYDTQNPEIWSEVLTAD